MHSICFTVVAQSWTRLWRNLRQFLGHWLRLRKNRRPIGFLGWFKVQLLILILHILCFDSGRLNQNLELEQQINWRMKKLKFQRYIRQVLAFCPERIFYRTELLKIDPAKDFYPRIILQKKTEFLTHDNKKIQIHFGAFCNLTEEPLSAQYTFNIWFVLHFNHKTDGLFNFSFNSISVSTSWPFICFYFYLFIYCILIYTYLQKSTAFYTVFS